MQSEDVENKSVSTYLVGLGVAAFIGRKKLPDGERERHGINESEETSTSSLLAEECSFS